MRTPWREGEQFVLDLTGTPLDLRVPWEGRSPRALTRVALGLILKTRGEKSVSEVIDPEQYDLFDAERAPPGLWEGAPTLLPLPWEA